MSLVKNILSIIILLLIAISICTPFKVEATSLSDVLEGGDIFTRSADTQGIFNSENQKNAADDMYFIMLGIGIILAFVIGIILGIQFITTGAEGQAKIKEKLLPYIIGCIVVFGGFGIWRFVVKLSTNTLESNKRVETEYNTQQLRELQKQKKLQELQELPKSTETEGTNADDGGVIDHSR